MAHDAPPGRKQLRKIRRCDFGGKIRYRTKNAAENAAIRIVLKADEPLARQAALSAYECHDCGDWHVGHSTGKKWPLR